jgi:formylglycine-generating enzyme required for sulfatase activity
MPYYEPLSELLASLNAGLRLMRYPWVALLLLAHLSAISPAQGKTSNPERPQAINKTRKNPKDDAVYAWIPSGSFMMGCLAGDEECFSEEKPSHRVTLTHGFWIGETEVTVAAYKRFAGIGDKSRPAAVGHVVSDDSMPAVDVTWDEANDYCRWAGGRLPTEAEWEYAARGGNAQAGNTDLNAVAWFQNNSDNTSHPVAQKRSNASGLFDTLGNVWEWVNDWYDGDYYSTSSEFDPPGPPDGKMRVLRGGSWLNPSRLVRQSDRGRSIPEARFNYFGLRCIWTPHAP